MATQTIPTGETGRLFRSFTTVLKALAVSFEATKSWTPVMLASSLSLASTQKPQAQRHLGWLLRITAMWKVVCQNKSCCHFHHIHVCWHERRAFTARLQLHMALFLECCRRARAGIEHAIGYYPLCRCSFCSTVDEWEIRTLVRDKSGNLAASTYHTTTSYFCNVEKPASFHLSRHR